VCADIAPQVLKSHILDFASDVYGQQVALRFHKRLREERIFPSIMDLSAQIGRDVEATRAHFAALRRREEAATAAAAAGRAESGARRSRRRRSGPRTSSGGWRRSAATARWCSP